MRSHSVIAAADSRPIRDRNSKAATVAIAAAAGKKMYSRERNRVTAALGRHR